ncbi:MAG TPA: hypothetical protein DCM26_02515 [Desulfotomaculum sp.]|jgi:uncharacterized membrane protein|nr:hypothetical protein [Desulfotomaculum sp.]
MNAADVMEFLVRNRGKVAGVVLGLAFGWLVIKYGIIKTFFVALCAGIGYYVGKRLDERVDFKELISGLFRRD